MILFFTLNIYSFAAVLSPHGYNILILILSSNKEQRHRTLVYDIAIWVKFFSIWCIASPLTRCHYWGTRIFAFGRSASDHKISEIIIYFWCGVFWECFWIIAGAGRDFIYLTKTPKCKKKIIFNLKLILTPYARVYFSFLLLPYCWEFLKIILCPFH